MAYESKRRKTPYEKKQDEYDKDRYPTPESPHQFRKGKPRKKKGVNRQERRRVRDMIHNTLRQEASELTPQALAEAKEEIRSFPWKGADTLREIIARKMGRRVVREKYSAKKNRKATPDSPQNAV